LERLLPLFVEGATQIEKVESRNVGQCSDENERE